MNKNLLIGGAAILVLLVGVYVMTRPQTTSAPTPTNQANMPAGNNDSTTDNTITISLSEQNDSGEMGTATLVEQNGQVVVNLTMTGSPPAVAQPAHIHRGSCPDVGEVVYPLTNVVDGVSVTTIDATFDTLKAQMPLGLNVHKSTSEASVYVSCGDLEF